MRKWGIYIKVFKLIFIVTVALLLSSCNSIIGGSSKEEDSTIIYLKEARKNFQTNLLNEKNTDSEAVKPASKDLELIKYDTEIGKMSAYISPDPKDGSKKPLIIWLSDGFANSISDISWKEQTENDQSASIYRKSGILMMYPSLRGGNKNPGNVESFYGEVNDVFSALKYAASLDYVDKERIYLGGHGTGGTIALLAAEYDSGFRAVFSFGPVADISDYGQENLNFDINDKSEVAVRSPILFLNTIFTPTFVFESIVNGNFVALEAMRNNNKNKNVHFYAVESVDHFSILSPANKLIAEKINNDIEKDTNIIFSNDEIQNLSDY